MRRTGLSCAEFCAGFEVARSIPGDIHLTKAAPGMRAEWTVNGRRIEERGLKHRYDLRHACVSTWLNAGYVKCADGGEPTARARVPAAPAEWSAETWTRPGREHP